MALLDPMAVLVLVFVCVCVFFFFNETPVFSIVAVPTYIPTNSSSGFPFLCIFANICYF